MWLSRLNVTIQAGALVLAVCMLAATAHAAGKVHVVKMLNKSMTDKKERMVFEPSILKVSVGDTVRFVSTDRGHKSASIKRMLPEGVKRWTSRIGKDFEMTFDKNGTYGYMCTPHYGMGMVGLILVGDYRVNFEEVAKKRQRGKAKKRFDQMFAEVRETEQKKPTDLVN